MKPETEKYLAKAQDCLEDAHYLLKADRWTGTINRSYYAIFDCIQALLFEKGVFAKTHQGAQQKFFELFVQTGIFSVEMGKQVKKVFEKRQTSDYDPDSDLDRVDAENAFQQAQTFYEQSCQFLKKPNP